MWRYNAQQFTRRDDLGPFPISRKVPDIPRNEKIRPRGIRTFYKYVVVRVGGDLEPPCGLHEVRVFFDQPKEPLLKPLSDVKLGARHHRAVFLEDRG